MRGCAKYSDKLHFALQLKLDKSGSVMSPMRHTPVPLWTNLALRTVGWRAPWWPTKVGLLMWSSDQTHKERLADKMRTMAQRPHEDPLLAAKGHTQYKWFKAKLSEQEGVNKEKMKLKACQAFAKP